MNISIQLDFEVTPTLAELYMQSTQCSFIGYKVPLTLEEATQKLNQYSQTKRYGKFERLAIMKIWEGDTLIGFSLPRAIMEIEYRAFKIENSNKDWYRIGTIFIGDQYRGKGVTSKVVKLFKERYPNLIWQCEEGNIGSAKAAEKAGLDYSHHIYFKDSTFWSFDKDEEFTNSYMVFSTK